MLKTRYFLRNLPRYELEHRQVGFARRERTRWEQVEVCKEEDSVNLDAHAQRVA